MMTRSRGWPDLRNDSSMPSYRASATPIRVNPSTATVAPSGMAATASRTEAKRNVQSSQHVPAADVDDLARDVTSLVRGQERDHCGDVGGLPHAAQRDLRHLLLADRVRDAAGHLRVNESRADRIHRYL